LSSFHLASSIWAYKTFTFHKLFTTPQHGHGVTQHGGQGVTQHGQVVTQHEQGKLRKNKENSAYSSRSTTPGVCIIVTSFGSIQNEILQHDTLARIYNHLSSPSGAREGIWRVKCNY